MRRSRKGHRQVVALALAAFAALAAGCGGDDDKDSSATSSKKAAKASFLFVANAESGTLTPRGGGKDSYTLRLNGVSGSVTAFSDRPRRITFNEPSSRFFGRGWDAVFGKDPPNAALDLAAPGQGGGASILELSNPRRVADSVTFDAVFIKQPRGGLAHYEGRARSTPPRRFGAASLFIDAGDSECNARFPRVELEINIARGPQNCDYIFDDVVGPANQLISCRAGTYSTGGKTWKVTSESRYVCEWKSTDGVYDFTAIYYS